MSRHLLSLAILTCIPLSLIAGDPKPDPVERQIILQRSIATAEGHLREKMPAAAVAVLEGQLANAEGSQKFLSLLESAYTAELRQLESASTANPERIKQLERKLDLLRDGGPEPNKPEPMPMAAVAPPTAAAAEAAPAAPAAKGNELLNDARALFKQGKYADAAAKFASARGQGPLTADEVTAWAYCRVRAAADLVNKPGCDAATAAALEKDVTEALQLAANNQELQRVGQAVLAVARQKAKGNSNPTGGAAAAATAVPADWETIETASFLVRFKGSRETAEAVAKAAEEKRKETFTRWSGPPSGAWSPKCEIVLHPTAECYTKMTGKQAAGKGHTTVRLAEGRATERRVDLRADDEGVIANALPREMTHVVLADLFPYTPPPKWAEEGMAVLAGSPEEVSRYVRTLPRCAQNHELFPVATLLDMKEFPPANKITGFYCESVALVDHLVKLKGEANFTIFLRDCQRYGTASALKRQYNTDPRSLEQAYQRPSPGVARGQAP